MTGKFSLCVPAKAGAATGAVVGLVVWALVSFVPAFHNGVPQPVVDVLPFALAWLGHTAAAWIAPHPGAVPVSPPPDPVTAVPAARAEAPGAAGTAGGAVSGMPR